MMMHDKNNAKHIAAQLEFPLMVKPVSEGSSIGMNKAETLTELITAWEAAVVFDQVMVEQWVTGNEYTVGILNGLALPIIRLETPNQFYDYEAKYCVDTTQYHCPSGLSDEQEAAIQQLALKASEVVGVTGWSRVDLFVDQQHQPSLIEVNTVPGMTDHSLVPMAAKAAGINFETLVWRILETSFNPVKYQV
jgi:D-alanine-D-alanine ligase